MTTPEYVSLALSSVAALTGLWSLVHFRESRRIQEMKFEKFRSRVPMKDLPSSAKARVKWKREQPNKCRYCGIETVDYGNDWNRKTIDHVIPRVRGGKDHPKNWSICCLGCNKDKGNLTAQEWKCVRIFRERNGNPHPLPQDRSKP